MAEAFSSECSYRHLCLGFVFVSVFVFYFIDVQVAVDFDADKMRLLKRPVKPFPARRRAPEFGSVANGPWQLQCVG